MGNPVPEDILAFGGADGGDSSSWGSYIMYGLAVIAVLGILYYIFLRDSGSETETEGFSPTLKARFKQAIDKINRTIGFKLRAD